VYKAFIEDCQLALHNTNMSLAATTTSIIIAAGHTPPPLSGSQLCKLHFNNTGIRLGLYKQIDNQFAQETTDQPKDGKSKKLRTYGLFKHSIQYS
jgi:hypothetical protein